MMAFTAETGSLPAEAWLLYVGNVLWTVVYDTEYAMVDRDDDLKIGVKSTAILFADADRHIIGFLQLMFVVTMWLVAQRFSLGFWYYLSLAVVIGLFVHQQRLISERNRDDCFKAFLQNNYVGMAVFVGTMMTFWFDR